MNCLKPFFMGIRGIHIISISVNTPSGAMTERIRQSAESALRGQSRGIRTILPFLGPAFVAAIAYVDPGNYATNIQSGSLFGYRLLWVILFANLMAMMMQILSSKLGIATGKNLAEICGDRFGPFWRYVGWAYSEISAMATDVAEFLGASLGLYLLFGIPLLYAAVVTGVVTYLILLLDRKGFRPLEVVIAGMILVIAGCYVIETFLVHPPYGTVAVSAVTPWLGNLTAATLAVGIIGATIMPHALFLHSGLQQDRIVPKTPEEAMRIHRGAKIDAILAMSMAGLVNMAMLVMAAAAFHFTGHPQIAQIPTAYRTLTPILGGAAAAVFLTSLVSSGISSSAVGTMAGQMIMQGFVGFYIPVWARRVATMLPSVVIILLGINPTAALVVSQVILSFVLPLPLIALTKYTSDRKIMGVLANTPLVTATAWVLTSIVIMLNLFLLAQTFGIV